MRMRARILKQNLALTFGGLSCAAALAFVAGAGCSAREEPMTAQDAAPGIATSPPPGVQNYPQQANPLPPMQGPVTDPNAAQSNLDLAEKELGFALQNKTLLGEPLDTTGKDKCSVVCKALTSMRNSAQQVCTLAADQCASATDRVKKAEERARGACPTCSGTPT